MLPAANTTRVLSVETALLAPRVVLAALTLFVLKAARALLILPESLAFSSCLGKTTSRLVPSLEPASYNTRNGLDGMMSDLVKCAI